MHWEEVRMLLVVLNGLVMGMVMVIATMDMVVKVMALVLISLILFLNVMGMLLNSIAFGGVFPNIRFEQVGSC